MKWKCTLASQNGIRANRMAEIVQFHPKPSALAGFLRIGHANHRKLEALQAAGRLPYRRLVFEAAHLRGDATTRSRPLAFRGGGGGISAILGR